MTCLNLPYLLKVKSLILAQFASHLPSKDLLKSGALTIPFNFPIEKQSPKF